MANQSVPATVQAANELSIPLSRLLQASVMASLAAKAEQLDPADARTAFHMLTQLIDEVHNDVDLVRERLAS